MGFWTWTDARKEPKILKNGRYSETDIIGYGGYAKIVCPDNTEIVEPCYDGCGMFDGKDAYELVVDWNKPYLEEIFNRLAENGDFWGSNLRNLAVLYQNDKPIEAEIKRLSTDRWKREIGIAIACKPEDNKALPFPLKITKTKWKKKYDELFPSCYCQ